MGSFKKIAGIVMKKILESGTIVYEDDSGLFHRLDGPAIEYANGNKEWYVNGERHRLDGPAVEYNDGYKEWYMNDNIHRIDGPAIIHSDNEVFYYLNGIEYSFKEWDRLRKLQVLL